MKRFILFTFSILLTFYSANSQSNPVIGDFYEGGILFWIDPAGGQGLVCDTVDLGNYIEWGCSGTSITTSTSIGSGLQNTLNIINNCSQTGIAAELCYNSTNNGYTDWFLPSKEELNQMYIHNNYIGLSSSSYWSSSDFDGNGNNPFNFPINEVAYGQNGSSGWQGAYLKVGYTSTNSASDGFVRAIRAISLASNIYGCTDSTACNYDLNANTDDGSCQLPDGCTNPTALNYDANATCDDGSCYYSTYGCTDPAASNYDATATVDDGTCIYNNAFGCTDSLALNYDSTATVDDGTCCGAGISVPFGTQIGQDIDGEAAGDESGRSVSISSDGQIVAIGAPSNGNAGHVRVYKNINGNWVQLGQDIDGEATGDYFGYSVSLSSDGNILAVGAIHNDGNGSSAGHVRVYNYNGSSWNQIGNDIDGEASADYSGKSLSISSDGQIVAIGANGNDANGSNAGHVRVYNYDGSSWNQLGQDIDGEAGGDDSGWSVSISSDGQIVAIGATGNDANGSYAGHVRVYNYNGSSWNQLGQDIDGEAGGDRSGRSVSLSSDGQIVAIGAFYNDGNGSDAGHVRIYNYTAWGWTQLGTDINGEATEDRSGESISLSSDGQTIAIGACQNDGSYPWAGHVRIYNYNGSSWNQIGNDIDGEAQNDESGRSVSLSSDGNTVAIGSFQNDGNGGNSGHVRVYSVGGFQYTSSPCSGCTDSLAINYDPYSLISDSSCTYSGCMDSTASNYNPSAITDDGSCILAVYGCTDSLALNYDSTATVDDSTCCGSLSLDSLQVTQIASNIEPIIQWAFRFGSSVSMSSNGEVVAIGIPDAENGFVMAAGAVEIFHLNGGNWTRIGLPLFSSDNTDYERFGKSVSLSNDGYTVVIGNNPYGSQYNYSKSVVYYWTGSSWAQKGQALLGPIIDNGYYPVSISSDGNTVAIGASGDDATNPGHVKIYNYNGSSWNQIGNDIDGEAAGDRSGRSISLSDDGNTVAIGAPLNDGNGTNSGHVRIYNFDGNSWVQIGQDIDGEYQYHENGTSVSLSSDGNTVAIGAYQANGANGLYSGHVRVYNFDGSSWNQLGQDIDGEATDDRSGYSVSLSADGNTVAIGADRNDGNGSDAGHVRIYNWNGLSWNQIGDDIDGEAAGDGSGYSVSLSDDGNTVAIGSPYGGLGSNPNWYAGHVRVFNIPNQYTSPPCSGCTDSLAINYDPYSLISDNTCIPYIYGCTDSTANNYDASANTDDGSCYYCDISNSVTITNPSSFTACDGWALTTTSSNYPIVSYNWYDSQGSIVSTSNFALSLCNNFYVLSVTDTAGCVANDTIIVGILPVLGCTDPTAYNYNPLANTDDGSCGYCDLTNSFMVIQNTPNNCDGLILANSSSSNGPINYLWSNGSTQNNIIGLCAGTYSVLINDAVGCNIIDTVIIGTLPIFGCTDPTADNYDTAATLDDGTCYTCNISNSITISNPSNLTSCDGWAVTNSFSSYPIISYTWLNSQGVSVSTTNFAINLCNDTYTLNVIDSAGCVASDTIIIGILDVYGCTDPTADNYDANANTDDGSCTYSSSCTEPAPTGLNVTNIVHNRVTINWDNMNDADCMVDQYRIKYRAAGTSSWSQKNMGTPLGSCTWPCNKTDKLILNLTSGTTYEYQMRAWYCGGSNSAWTSLHNFTTLDDCPNIGNLSVTTPTTTKATFTWDDSNGPYSFVRLKSRVDTIVNPSGSDWFNIGGAGVVYPTFTKNKNNLTPGQSYRAQARTWCDPSGGPYKSDTWTSLVYWTMPTSIRIEGGESITHLDIYPNPSRDIFNISFTSEQQQNLKVRILNVIGEELISDDLQQFIGEYTKQIDLTNNAKGIYFLEIETDNGVINKKLILQ